MLQQDGHGVDVSATHKLPQTTRLYKFFCHLGPELLLEIVKEAALAFHFLSNDLFYECLDFLWDFLTTTEFKRLDLLNIKALLEEGKLEIQ